MIYILLEYTVFGIAKMRSGTPDSIYVHRRVYGLRGIDKSMFFEHNDNNNNEVSARVFGTLKLIKTFSCAGETFLVL